MSCELLDMSILYLKGGRGGGVLVFLLFGIYGLLFITGLARGGGQGGDLFRFLDDVFLLIFFWEA